MEKLDQSSNITKQKLIEQLQQFGFENEYILKAAKYTTSKQIAAEIIVKLMQQGQNADLSIYQSQMAQEIPPIQKEEQIKESEHEYKAVKPKMLFVINGQLKMGKGKICAQVGHAVIGAYLQIQQQGRYDKRSANRLNVWESSGSPKIVVKAQNYKQMLKIQKELQGLKIDAGHTQIKAGSKTVLAIGPAFAHEIDPITEYLKLV